MIDQQVFNTIFGAIDYTKEETLKHYTEQADLAAVYSELSARQFDVLVKFWRDSRRNQIGFTADDTIRAIDSIRSTPMQEKAIKDFKYYVTITEFAEARV